MKYFIQKMISLVITLLIVSLITFFIFQILPGDPVLVMLGVDANPLQAEQLREELGLNMPFYQQYINWILGILKGDLGTSLKYSLPVSGLLAARIEPTIILTILSLSITIVIGFPLGIWLAQGKNKIFSYPVSILTQIGLSIPSFWIGMILILIFSISFNIFPSGGYIKWSDNPVASINRLILPACSIACGTTATFIRFFNTSIKDTLNSPFIITAKSKGLSDQTVMYRHVVRNALIPVVTIMGMVVTEILAGSIITESVFLIPGLGSLITTSISSRDFPLIQVGIMYIAAIVVIINSFVDILYGIIDPRIRLH